MSLHDPKFKKWFSGLLIGWGLLFAASGVFMLTQPVSAQTEGSGGGAEASAAAHASKLEFGDAISKLDAPIMAIIGNIVLMSMLQVVDFMFERLAHDAALAISSGGTGQEPLIFGKPPSEAAGNFGQLVAGEALGSLNDILASDFNLNFNLCAPQTPELRFTWQIGLLDVYQPPEPRCDWQQVSQNWDAFVSSIQNADHSTDAIMREVAKGFRPSQNELGAAISFRGQVMSQSFRFSAQKSLEQLFGGGYKDVTDPVTGQILSPSSLVRDSFEQQVVDSAADQKEYEFGAFLETVDWGLYSVAAVSKYASVFLRTLLAGPMQDVFTGMFETRPPTDPFNPELASGFGQDQAENQFSGLVTSNPISLSNYNALGEFVTCPTSPDVQGRNINNCVMDQGFFTAVIQGESGRALTVQEAIDQGLLHGNWPLIPASDSVRNQDAFCHTYGYCQSNLAKMRKARVIPVGWEMAAEQNENAGDGLVTLQEAVDRFDDESSDNDFYHLIDPNWVLKYPETQCRARVFGETLASPLAGTRQKSCVDTPSCIDHDKDGNCIGGFGYCTRERNTWEFRGEECPAQYASCLSFDNTRTGENASYLINTVDFSVCNQNNVGCRWYRTNKYLDDKGTADPGDDSFEWLPTTETYDVATWESPATIRRAGSSRPVATGGLYTYEDRIYFNQNVQECDASAAGCSQLNEIGDTLVLNLVANPSFEDDEDDNGVPDRWVWETGTAPTDSDFETDGTNAFRGSNTVNANNGFWQQKDLRLAPNSFYTLSFYAKGNGSVEISMTDTEANDVDLSSTGANVSVVGDCSISGTDTFETGVANTEYERYRCTFSTAGEPLNADITFIGNSYYDAVQLELGEIASGFTDGYNTTSPDAVYLRTVPEYLNCTGGLDDPSECNQFAQVCSPRDVGCNRYTPEAGGPAIPAVTSDLDSCPAECVGYTTYKQEATRYEQEQFPLHFIADRATQCSAENVGCTGFTNLDTVAEGGEAVEYYTDLRACQTEEMLPPAADSATFFTWEGSDQAGFQLRTWTLLESNLADTDTINYTEPNVDSDTNAGLAPCTQWEMESETAIVCAEDEAGNRDAIAQNDACNERSDILVNPDCREFFDAQGNVHYRTVSETVPISDQCHPYRMNDAIEADCTDRANGFWDGQSSECRVTGLPEESDECPGDEAGCRSYTGGAGRNAADILFSTFEDGTYDDYAGVGVTPIVSNESIATNGHSLRLDVTGAGQGVETLYVARGNGECTDPDGCPVNQDGSDAADSDAAVCTVPEGETDCGTLVDQIVSGKTYMLSFWAKGNVVMDAEFVESGGASHSFTDDTGVTLTTDWRQFTIGPLVTSQLQTFDETAVLQFVADSRTDNTAFPGVFYLDNITLEQTEENITLIKDTWVVPSTCDTDPSGTASPQFYLGCAAYTDQNDNRENLYQFSRLCSDDAVGCEAFYDTQNSTSPYGQTFNVRCTALDGIVGVGGEDCTIDNQTYCHIETGRAYCTFDLPGEIPTPMPQSTDYRLELGPAAQAVSNDLPTYLVNDGSATCSAAQIGCEAVGVPQFNQDKTAVESFEETYILNTPEDYNDLLCAHDALFCEEWASTDDGNFYFKHPENQLCEYKNGVSINNTKYSGWFRNGTNEPCYYDDSNGNGQFDASEIGSAYLIGGETFGVWNNGDPNYDGWVAQCPTNQNRCTAFGDPTDTQDGQFPDGTVYTFLNDDRMSEDGLPGNERCDGGVSRKEGCVLFNDRNEPQLTYSADPSYLASKHADYLFGDAKFSKQNPIDCNTSQRTVTPPSTGESINLCSSLCSYLTPSNVDLTVDVEEVFSIVGRGNASLVNSCVFDADCPNMMGTDGKDYSGECELNAGTSVENDTNTILKVNRDRECAQWLACKSAQPTYDPRAGQWINKCDQVGLCNDYGTTGDAAFCSSWAESDDEILNRVQYANRDVSWTGLDYAGYSIPDQLPIDHYEEVNLSSEGDPDVRLANLLGACDSETTPPGGDCVVGYCESSPELACNDDADCPGNTCVTTVCQESGDSCAKDEDCDTENGFECNTISETCKRVATETDADGNEIETICSFDGDCSGDEICSLSPRSDRGACYNNHCMQGLDGERLASIDDAEIKACRGYPEAEAPYWSGTDDCLNVDPDTGVGACSASGLTCFVNEDGSSEGCLDDTGIVEEWKDFENNDGQSSRLSAVATKANAVPFSLRQRFQNVNTCDLKVVEEPVFDEGGDPVLDSNGKQRIKHTVTASNCACSYDKVQYGETRTADSGMTKYYEVGEEDIEDITAQSVCVGGPFDGKFCEKNVDCGDPDDPDSFSRGTCQKPSKKDTVLGWEGFCLEHDQSINLYNNEGNNFRPCSTWYPVDQLAGSTDLFAKFTEAGFENKNTYYCEEVRDFYDIYTSSQACAETDGSGFTIGCNERPVSSGWFNTDDGQECVKSMVCPPGFFSIITGCGEQAPQVNGAPMCQEGAENKTGRDDCPFRCIPKLSYHQEGPDAGEKCLPPAENASDVTDERPIQARAKTSVEKYQLDSDGNRRVNDAGVSEYWIDVYALNSKSDKEYVKGSDYYEDCAVRGVDVEQARQYLYQSDVDYPLWSGEEKPANPEHYYNRDIEVVSYLACSALAQTSSNSIKDGRYNAAWTDRAWTEGNGFTIDTDSPDFRYQTGTPNVPFAKAVPITDYLDIEAVATDPWPERPGVCVRTDGEVIKGVSTCSSGTERNELDVGSYRSGALSERGAFGQTFPLKGLTSEGSEAAANRLLQIFALGMDLYTWDTQQGDGVRQRESDQPDSEQVWTNFDEETGSGNYALVDPDDPDSRDLWESTIQGDGSISPIAPTLYSVGSCSGTECTQGRANAFSIDNIDQGTIVGGNGEKSITARFFAQADPNQMPIRNMIMDWGDGVRGTVWDTDEWPTTSQSGSKTNDNFYQNHMGTGECNGSNFGRSARACDTTYVAFQHDYVCTAGMVANALPQCEVDEETGNLVNAPCTGTAGGFIPDGDGRCVFQPRVSVKDNWGWCTGTCIGGEDGTDGCYDARQFGSKEASGIEEGAIPFSHTNECNWSECPGGNGCVANGDGNHHPPIRGSDDIDPWIYFDGYVTVEP